MLAVFSEALNNFTIGLLQERRQNAEIRNWQVHTANPNKIRTVTTESLTEEQIQSRVKKAGFKVEIAS